jgi:hypothetical protein
MLKEKKKRSSDIKILINYYIKNNKMRPINLLIIIVKNTMWLFLFLNIIYFTAKCYKYDVSFIDSGVKKVQMRFLKIVMDEFLKKKQIFYYSLF